ncbi:MAG TPA: hypothetical protein ACN46Y_07770, partial [Prochlorococcus sp.]
AVERLPYKQDVAGSIPASPISLASRSRFFLGAAARSESFESLSTYPTTASAIAIQPTRLCTSEYGNQWSGMCA